MSSQNSNSDALKVVTGILVAIVVVMVLRAGVLWVSDWYSQLHPLLAKLILGLGACIAAVVGIFVYMANSPNGGPESIAVTEGLVTLTKFLFGVIAVLLVAIVFLWPIYVKAQGGLQSFQDFMK